MCDPVTIAAAALSAAGQVVSYNGQVAATNAANAQAAAAHRNAGMAAQSQYEDYQRKFIYESRENQQKGMEAAMAGRAAVARGVAAAGASGIDASSLSVTDLLNEQRRQTAQNLQNVSSRQSDLTQAFQGDVRASQQTAQGRIDASPWQTGPSKLGLMIGLASTGVGAYKDYKGKE